MTHTEVFKNCFVCDYKEVTAALSCPKCGKPLQTESTIRVFGGVLSFLGLLLIALMSFVIKGVGTANRIDRPGHYGETARNAPSEGLVYFILIAVLLMGVSTLLAGGWMVVTGRRNLKLLWLMIGFGLALSGFAYIFAGFVS
ncbi:MAG TPA: hypothetical protein VJV05_09675 [Pyrinomonadaceae bacterium]|nr:hypothetical protein [Pyrinomonadaceae bacterium]